MDLKTPLVSVVLPTYNRAYCIADTINSVLAQTYSNLELLVVDDGSTDGTRELIGGTFGHDPRVRYAYRTNGRVSAARNTGLEMAQGDFVAFIDSDDLWEPWKLELQMACFRHCPELAMVWTDMCAVDADGSVVSRSYLRKMYSAYQWFGEGELFTGEHRLAEIAPGLSDIVGSASLHTGSIFSQMVTGNLVHTSTVVLRRDVVQKAGTFKTELAGAGEDYEFYLRASRFGPGGLAQVPSIVYQIGRPDQITTASGLRFASKFIDIIQPILREEREHLTLSDGLIHRVLADAYCWHGTELMKSGRRSQARGELIKSLREQSSTQAVYYLVRSLLPQGLEQAIRVSARPLKKAMRPKSQNAILMVLAGYWADFDVLLALAADLAVE